MTVNPSDSSPNTYRHSNTLRFVTSRIQYCPYWGHPHR